MQVKLHSVSEVSTNLWNISLENLIWLWNALRAYLLPQKMFAWALLPFSFRFASVLQVKMQSVSEVSAALWNISLESLIWLWNAFRVDLFPRKNFASVLLAFCFRSTSVMRVKLCGSKASEKGACHLESISAVRVLFNLSYIAFARNICLAGNIGQDPSMTCERQGAWPGKHKLQYVYAQYNMSM